MVAFSEQTAVGIAVISRTGKPFPAVRRLELYALTGAYGFSNKETGLISCSAGPVKYPGKPGGGSFPLRSRTKRMP